MAPAQSSKGSLKALHSTIKKGQVFHVYWKFQSCSECFTGRSAKRTILDPPKNTGSASQVHHYLFQHNQRQQYCPVAHSDQSNCGCSNHIGKNVASHPLTHLQRFLHNELPESWPLLFMCILHTLQANPCPFWATDSSALSRHTSMQLRLRL